MLADTMANPTAAHRRRWYPNVTLQQKITCACQGIRCAIRDKSFRFVTVHALISLALLIPWAPTLMAKAFFFHVILSQITFEFINTAFETTVNRISRRYHPLSREAKDMAAGASFWSQTIGLLTNIMGGIGVVCAMRAWAWAHPTLSWRTYLCDSFTS